MAKSATAKVMETMPDSIKSKVDSELTGGKHITAKAVALVIVGTSEEKKLDAARLQNLSLMIEGSKDEEVDQAIRGAEKTEKKIDPETDKLDVNNPVNYGPAVAEMCKLGMTVKAARVRISEIRSIVRAMRSGYKVKPALGWHKTIAESRATLDSKKESDKANKLSILRRNLLAEGLEKYSQVEDAAERNSRAEKYRDTQLVKLALEDEQKAADALIEREVTRIKHHGKDIALAICDAVAAEWNKQVVTMAKPAPKKAVVVEVDTMPNNDVTERETA